MISFIDGPAERTTLALHRAPLFLRVVESRNHTFDALDQLDDVAIPTERIHVYRQDPVEVVWVHLNMRSRGTGFYPMAKYRHVADVDGETVRETNAWRAWVVAQPGIETRTEVVGL